MVTIRTAKIVDVPEIVELWKEFMLDTRKIIAKTDMKLSRYDELNSHGPSLFKKFAVETIRDRNGLVLVAEEHGRLVGYSLSYIKKNIIVYKLAKLGHVSDLFVKKNYRRQRIGSRFKTRIFSWFASKGIKHATLNVSPANPNAYKAYLKWGFETYCLEMRRKL